MAKINYAQLIFFFTTVIFLDGCTWNASIKSIDNIPSSNSNGDLTTVSTECPEDVLTSFICKVSNTGKIITSIINSNITSWNNDSASNIITANIPTGYYYGQSCLLQDIDLMSSNIKFGINIFGVTGSYTETGSFQTEMASSALRDAGVQVIPNLAGQSISNQISLSEELNTYVGADLPTTNGYNYRDVPDSAKDDEGQSGTTCRYAPRPTNDCGTNQNAITARIADCLVQNPTTASWNGAIQCNGGQGVWKLVTRQGVNKEVWQDQRTKQLWSSILSTTINWCQASGNSQRSPIYYTRSYNNTAGTIITGNGTIGSLSGGNMTVTSLDTITFTSATTFSVSGSNCGGGSIVSGGLTTASGSMVTFSRPNYCNFTLIQGTTNFAVNDKFDIQSSDATLYSCYPAEFLQPAIPISYCSEVTGLNAPAGENWGTGVYLAAKGGMGKITTPQSPSVRWRLPSINDYKLADVNGIRFVLPDMGLSGTYRTVPDSSTAGTAEWSSTHNSSNRNNVWSFYSANGDVGTGPVASLMSVRCVGR